MALEQQLQVGDLVYGFGFPLETSGGGPGLITRGVHDATMKVKRVTETTKKTFFKNKIVTTVVHSEVAFRWLPWISGKINYANQEGRDVLSGMFTGCWMARFKDAGNFRIGHIATQNDDGDCKAVWRAHKAGGVSDVKEFRPDIGLPGTKNLGLITATGELYKFQLADEKNVPIPNPWQTVDEWMDPAKGAMTREFAQLMAQQAQVNTSDVYRGISAYRIVKMLGPLAPERFPA